MRKTLSTIALALSGLIGLMMSGASQAQDIQAQRLYNQSLAATCANCHGTNGVSVPGVAVPMINKLSESVMYERLMEYKTGKRTGTIMHQLAKGYTDEQLKTIASVLGTKN
ncbi:c-type cytochrome [Zwartia vadi]|uniref:c-type cytochrome n=1 Tax=Zwartia vadi TaxID=3058168 RepID=UPI0025B315B9|nr:c-type cytochrome [Zwartia vadi]MDN3987805.1 cytochrome C [Zwartia vadi]